MENKVRVRFAPSPTGPLHIGGVRTALYNYLFAKKHGGDFILRIEDTDQTRFVSGAEEYIVESLQWCGIQFNEGVHLGGPHQPYRQSERKNLYQEFADHLINSGYAYYAFDTPETLEKLRKEHESSKQVFQYGAANRMSLCNSLTLDELTVKQKISSGEPYVIRIKIPENESIEVHDLIRGKVIFESSLLDDKVLFKSDGLPTYHLANVVDDHLMLITHVIRGEEWLPSAPLHVLLYKYLGWHKSMPQFAHLPLLLKPDGNGKLSKRDGDKMGFPVFPLQWKDPKTSEISSGYRESGYIPEAVVNMLALLGWNSGTEQEIFSMNELINAFSLDRVGKAGSKFDPDKAKWFNHQYLQKKNILEVVDSFNSILQEKGLTPDKEFVTKICKMLIERVSFVKELWEQSSFFFIAPESFDDKSIKDKWKENTSALLTEIKENIATAVSFESNLLKENISAFIHEKQYNTGLIMNGLRICLVGASKGPDLFEIMELLGKDETLKRIDFALGKINK